MYFFWSGSSFSASLGDTTLSMCITPIIAHTGEPACSKTSRFDKLPQVRFSIFLSPLSIRSANFGFIVSAFIFVLSVVVFCVAITMPKSKTVESVPKTNLRC
jgi:hypothetical protein